MKYEDFLAGNDPNEIGEPLSIDIHTWKRDGERLIGELKEVTDFEGGSFDQKCKRYIFKTDNGLLSTILGANVDKQIDPKKNIGRVLCITYKGQIQLDDGRSCNRFTVVDLTDAFKNWERKKISSNNLSEVTKNSIANMFNKKKEVVDDAG